MAHLPDEKWEDTHRFHVDYSFARFSNVSKDLRAALHEEGTAGIEGNWTPLLPFFLLGCFVTVRALVPAAGVVVGDPAPTLFL